MTTPSLEQEKTNILNRLSRYHKAMVDADTDTLRDMLDNSFSLTHITGYEQPRDEWFGVMRSGAFNYHQITLNDTFTDVQVSGNTASLKGRGIFNATINGMKNPWRLAFTMRWARQEGVWTLMHAHYTTY